MVAKNNSNQQVIEAREAVLSTIKTSTKKNKSEDVDTTVMIKLATENSKLFRRYSFDDNGGGYVGL